MALRRLLLGLPAAVAGSFRRSLATATSQPPWAMMSVLGEAVEAPSVDVRLAEPPHVSEICVPEHLIKTRGIPDPASGVLQDIRGGIRAVSGDGLLLLSYVDLRFTAPIGGEQEPTRLDRAHVPSVTRFVCNPVTRELSRLPDSICTPTGDVLCDRHMSIITQDDRGHGPPDRFAVAVLQGNMMIRFLSETGEWEIVEVSPCRLPLARRMQLYQGAQAFGGRLWWVDVTWGAISADPFSDRPELSFVQLPKSSVLPAGAEDEAPVSYRRVGVSEGRLRYVEVSQEEPFLLSSFVLDEEEGYWMLEHRVVLNKIWGPIMWIPLQMKGTTSIVLIHPLNANIVYLMVMSQVVVVDMEEEEVIESCQYEGDDAPCIPCVLPSWLGSSRIPSSGKKDVEKSNTLADVLVRSSGHYKR
uniref:Uncharacterized protein n=1 Tax=Avena sativa TaxID=4498 RepID=A0ACD5TG59_AVESA